MGKVWPIELEDFLVTETNRPPPLFFKYKSTGKVFAALDRQIVRTAIHLNNDLIIQEGEIHYSAMTKEWVLGSVALSEEAYQSLGMIFRHGLARIQACPVSEKHDPTWGPVLP